MTWRRGGTRKREAGFGQCAWDGGTGGCRGVAGAGRWVAYSRRNRCRKSKSSSRNLSLVHRRRMRRQRHRVRIRNCSSRASGPKAATRVERDFRGGLVGSEANLGAVVEPVV